jgi:glycine/D-amino acid oxidase-like deaminating enzyme/nitrite reductase/ring-hydroxylating ferredoxin subunit
MPPPSTPRPPPIDTTSHWRADRAERVRPALGGDSAADVVVVGAGITGLTTALLLARGGRSVAVVERHTIGAGTTGNTTAKVTALHGLIYDELIGHAGAERARAYADANVAGVGLVAELAASVAPASAPTPSPTYTFAWDDAALDGLRSERDAAASVGLTVDLVDDPGLPFAVAGALRWEGGLHLHPQRYLDGLAAELERLGGTIHEQSPVSSIDDRDDGVTVHTHGGSVRADTLVVATLLPFVDIGGFFATTTPHRSYALAALLDSAPPDGMYISSTAPVRSVRPCTFADGPGVIASGPGHKPGEVTETGAYYDELDQWVTETFDVRAVVARWSAEDFRSTDGIPYVGSCPRTTNVLVATGFRKWGLSNGTAAALMLCDQILGVDNPWAETFDASRGPAIADAPQLVTQNLAVARHAVLDRLQRLSPSSLRDLPLGGGRIVDGGDEAIGAYRDEGGLVHAVSLSCTHLGCTVQWNEAERSWDCPCHGSRFGFGGEVLEGPALEPLTSVEIRDVSPRDAT